jgi:cell shape-determining protein MreD
LVALRWRRAASIIATVVLTTSIVVGFLGAYFHVVRAIRPAAPLGERVTIPLLVWAPPIVGMLLWPWVLVILRDLRRKFQVS